MKRDLRVRAQLTQADCRSAELVTGLWLETGLWPSAAAHRLQAKKLQREGGGGGGGGGVQHRRGGGVVGEEEGVVL